MIRDVASSVAAKSDVPFSSEAVTSLEQALEPIFEALMVAALRNAVAAGRDSITEKDINAVKGKIIGKGKGKGKKNGK